MPVWLQAGFWGVFAGGALVLGAAVGYSVRLPQKIIAGVMAFGSGVLISALSFELTEESYHQAGLIPTAIGFFAGALLYSGANGLLSRAGAKHRKRSSRQPSEDDAGGSGTAVAAGAILSMLAETMIPEAFEGTHNWAGLITCAGFICAFALSMPGG